MNMTLGWLFSDFLDSGSQEAPGDSFLTCSGFQAQRARNRSVVGRAFSRQDQDVQFRALGPRPNSLIDNALVSLSQRFVVAIASEFSQGCLP